MKSRRAQSPAVFLAFETPEVKAMWLLPGFPPDIKTEVS